MKYDDAEFCFLNFETELANEAGGTHTGMYLAWAAQRGLLGDAFAGAEGQRQVARLLAREITGRDLYFDRCDGKLTSDDLSEQGNAFTAWYYEKQFVLDYERVFREQIPDTGHATDDFCSVADTWANCDRLARALDHRFSQWIAGRNAPAAGGAANPPAGTAASPPHDSGTSVPNSARPQLTLVAVPAGVPEARDSAPSEAPARRAGPRGQKPSSSSPATFKLHAGHLALLIGAAAFLILLALATSLTGGPLKGLAVALAAIGAFGVHRCSGELGHPVASTWLLTGLALIPVAGSMICILVLLWVVRRFQEGRE
jgi:hypothetical protein